MCLATRAYKMYLYISTYTIHTKISLKLILYIIMCKRSSESINYQRLSMRNDTLKKNNKKKNKRKTIAPSRRAPPIHLN